LAELDLAPATLVFTGGTCLSKAWGLIERFSEDVDFKALVPAEYGRPQRRAMRKAIEEALIDAGFTLVEPPKVGDEGRFFIFYLDYGSAFPALPGLRPHIQVEVSLRNPKLAPVSRPVRSFVAQARQQGAEVVAIGCADPVETAAEKLSALAWRVLSPSPGAKGEDPSIIRHLHDLAALEGHALGAPAFAALAGEVVDLDAGRGNQNRPKDFVDLLRAALTDLTEKPHWRGDYELFIRGVSYATDDRVISFDAALAALRRLIMAVTERP
jgi:hypothetical protein